MVVRSYVHRNKRGGKAAIRRKAGDRAVRMKIDNEEYGAAIEKLEKGERKGGEKRRKEGRIRVEVQVRRWRRGRSRRKGGAELRKCKGER